MTPQCPDPSCASGSMDLVERNYHGTGEDVFQCEECGKHYAVKYAVASVTPLPDWDLEDANDA